MIVRWLKKWTKKSYSNQKNKRVILLLLKVEDETEANIIHANWNHFTGTCHTDRQVFATDEPA